MSARANETMTRYFAESDVSLGGPRPTDIQVLDPRFFPSSVAAGFRSRNADVWQVLLSRT